MWHRLPPVNPISCVFSSSSLPYLSSGLLVAPEGSERLFRCQLLLTLQACLPDRPAAATPPFLSPLFFFTALFITCHHLTLFLAHLSSLFPMKMQPSRGQGRLCPPLHRSAWQSMWHVLCIKKDFDIPTYRQECGRSHEILI